MVGRVRATRSIVIALVALWALAGAAGCGGDATPSPGPTAVATTPAAPSPAATAGEVTLSIASVEPAAVAAGGSVTVVFETQPGNAIGLQVTDPGGRIMAQTMINADEQGRAVYEYTVSATTAGTWRVDAAAGRTMADLLQLQANPIEGPHSDFATFEVQ